MSALHIIASYNDREQVRDLGSLFHFRSGCVARQHAS
jgi:hypothetical protein